MKRLLALTLPALFAMSACAANVDNSGETAKGTDPLWISCPSTTGTVGIERAVATTAIEIMTAAAKFCQAAPYNGNMNSGCWSSTILASQRYRVAEDGKSIEFDPNHPAYAYVPNDAKVALGVAQLDENVASYLVDGLKWDQQNTNGSLHLQIKAIQALAFPYGTDVSINDGSSSRRIVTVTSEAWCGGSVLNFKDIAVNTNKFAPIEGVTISQGAMVQAEAYTAQQGTQKENNNTTVGYFDSGDYLCYANMDLTGVTRIDARMASANSGGVLSVRVGSSTGTEIGRMTVQSTGGWTAWATRSIPIAATSGMQTVCFKGESGGGIANFDNFTLARPSAYTGSSSKPTTPFAGTGPSNPYLLVGAFSSPFDWSTYNFPANGTGSGYKSCWDPTWCWGSVDIDPVLAPVYYNTPTTAGSTLGLTESTAHVYVSGFSTAEATRQNQLAKAASTTVPGTTELGRFSIKQVVWGKVVWKYAKCENNCL